METIGNITIGNVRDPKRLIVGSDQAFQCTVDLQIPGGQVETVAYVANKDDHVETGKYVYEQIISGAAGEIEDFVMPVLTDEQLAEGARHQRTVLLGPVDAIVTNPLRWSELTPAQQEAISQYRRDLLDITDQEGFPTNIVWPQSPLG